MVAPSPSPSPPLSPTKANRRADRAPFQPKRMQSLAIRQAATTTAKQQQPPTPPTPTTPRRLIQTQQKQQQQQQQQSPSSPHHQQRQRQRRTSRSRRSHYATKRWVTQLLWIWTAALALLFLGTYRRLLQSLRHSPRDENNAAAAVASSGLVVAKSNKVAAPQPQRKQHFLSSVRSRSKEKSASSASNHDDLSLSIPENNAVVPPINNERTRGLLELVQMAESQPNGDGDDASPPPPPPPWPSYLTLAHHSSSSHTTSNKEETSHETTTTNSSSCIVTAYFRVPNKYSNEKYENDWMQNVLALSDCMVIFCEDHMVETMLKFRERDNRQHQTAIVTISLQDLPIARYYYPSGDTTSATKNQEKAATAFWEQQFALDPEQKRHRSYQLFWIWLSKSWFVSTAIILQQHLFPTATTTETTPPIQYWMWADIGSFRRRLFRRGPFIRHPEILNGEDVVVWMAHRDPNPPQDPLWNRKLREKEHFYHSGSHGFGTAPAWIRFHAAFVDTLERYAGKFIGEDQCVLQSACLVHGGLCAYAPADQVPDNRYFGLRHLLRFGPVGRDDERVTSGRLRPFRLWRPPPLSLSLKQQTKMKSD